MRRHNKYSAGSGRFGFCQMMLSAVLLVGWSASAKASIWLDGTVATMQALDKITARISTRAAPVGEPRQFGTLEGTVQHCVFHPPEETPENAAFVVIRDLGYDPSAPPTEVISERVFSSSPGL